MRKTICVLALAAGLVTGCVGGSSQSPVSDRTATNRPDSALTPERPSLPPTEGDLSQDDTDATIDRVSSISPEQWRQADAIVSKVCGIVTYRIVTYEFPNLWVEGSAESRLAREYGRIIGGGFDDELERECPAYGRLHSKNH